MSLLADEEARAALFRQRCANRAAAAAARRALLAGNPAPAAALRAAYAPLAPDAGLPDAACFECDPPPSRVSERLRLRMTPGGAHRMP